MIEIYRPEKERRSLLAVRVVSALLIAVCAAALIVCVRLCAGVNILNELRVRLCVTLVSAAAGWIVLLALDLFLLPSRAEYRHGRRVMEGTASPVSGEVASVSPPRHIRGSIDIREVILRTDSGPLRLLVSAKRASGFPPAGSAVTLRVSDGYITAYEVRHE